MILLKTLNREFSQKEVIINSTKESSIKNLVRNLKNGRVKGICGLCLFTLGICSLIFSAGVVFAAKYSPGVITGKVTDKKTNKPLADVSVNAYDKDGSGEEYIGYAKTDKNGNYTIKIPKRISGSQWDDPKTSRYTQWRPDIYISTFKPGYKGFTSKVYSNHKLKKNLRINAKM